jgi:hypothetical protein
MHAQLITPGIGLTNPMGACSEGIEPYLCPCAYGDTPIVDFCNTGLTPYRGQCGGGIVKGPP